MNNTFSIITAESVNNIVNKNPNIIYEAVKTAYIRHGQNQTTNPPSCFLKFPDKEKSRIIALPASIMQNPRIVGIKWISSNPDNLTLGLKRASAVIILNDYETGYPIACLEGGIISALRTVYSAILVSNLLVISKRKKTIGIVGTGNISEQFINCLNQQDWKINVIKLFDLNPQACIKLKEKIDQINPKIKVEIIKKLKELITESELIFLSTTSPTPYITELSWLSHNPIILNISLRDLAPETLIASNNIVDDITHVLNANTSPHLAQQKYGHADFINCTVAQLINGYNQFNNNQPIIFSPMGMGILDLAVANYVYNTAKSSNLCVEIDNFFNSND
jgi:2,3-diaminopropionate biosynthesis protein SbnB